ncbi:MAG TPA: ribonuclease HII [Candidatus Saccharimonadales bacterium]|jgi:ribonuclease HII
MVIIGIDEVGRGCWAGPLVAAAVVLDPEIPIAGLQDSKTLSKNQRELLAKLIHANAASVGIGWVWPEAIDISGITAAVKSAMEQAIAQIKYPYEAIIIDGNYNFLPQYAHVTTLVKADGLIPEVSAASIVAKVARDDYMATQAVDYPLYGFERHVGYGTAQHIAALQTHGVTVLHRKSFKPIQALLNH